MAQISTRRENAHRARGYLRDHDGVITTAAIANLRLPTDTAEGCVESGRWIAVARGVFRSAEAPQTLRQQLRIAAAVSGGALDDHSAIAWHGWWLQPDHVRPPLSVTISPSSSRRIAADDLGVTVRRRRIAEQDIAVVDGLPVLSLAAAAYATVDFDRSGFGPLRQLLDAGAVTGSEVMAAARRNRHWRGKVSLGLLSQFLSGVARADSGWWARFLTAQGIYGAVANCPIAAANRIIVVPIAFPNQRVILDAGAGWSALRADEWNWLTVHGWQILRIDPVSPGRSLDRLVELLERTLDDHVRFLARVELEAAANPDPDQYDWLDS